MQMVKQKEKQPGLICRRGNKEEKNLLFCKPSSFDMKIIQQ